MWTETSRGGGRCGLAVGGIRPRKEWLKSLLAMGLAVSLALGGSARCIAGESARGSDEARGRAFSYYNDRVPAGPWSVHVLKLDRASQEYEVDTVLARGTILGMETLTEQVKGYPTNVGRPVAAINGDFYRSGRNTYEGDPEGIQITHGELVSGPSGKACFWIDAAGRPRTDEVQSMFRVIWPDGTQARIGLNEQRSKDAAVLYTPRLGPSTGTSGGREYVLEAQVPENWLPLHVGGRYKARIRQVVEKGDTVLAGGTMVLSLGPALLEQAPRLKEGDVIEISMATLPEMAGCRTAMGGGPRLVVDGKPLGGWRSPNDRHPRTAVGWNDEHLFFVLVDGRQPGLSVGMSFTELANYFVKLGCKGAVNLDGGGSASMWLFGQTVNSPSEGRERPVANGVVIVKKHREAAQIND